MKQANAFKNLLLVSLIGAGSALNAQTTIHPKAFLGTVAGAGDTVNNFYKDYVGVRLDVTQPPVIAGDKFYTFATVPEGWGAITLSHLPLVNDTVVMPQTGDSCACSPITVNMTNKIALVWRGPESGACEFGAKALAAQNQGAVAVVIVNEYAGQGPVAMGPGADGASVHIPVYMIGNADGVALTQQYEDSVANGNPYGVKMTITPWGLELNNDLGFVPGGIGIGTCYAIPYIELNGSEAPPPPYKTVMGAFVANYGSHLATNVSLKDTLFWTPTGGSPVVVGSDAVSLANFPVSDSIWTMFGSEKNTTATTTGMFTINYHITSDTPDQFTSNNDLSYSFYTTDSLFSKGSYNFSANEPNVLQWYEPDANNYLWGVPYYVAQGGSAAKTVQVSCSSGPGLLPNGVPINIIVFKWVDGSFGTAADTNIQTGELTVVGGGSYTFNGVSDSSFDIFNISIWAGDSLPGLTGTFNQHPPLDSNSWYIVAADVEGASMALGCDGATDAYPRTYFRYHVNGTREMYNPLVDTDYLSLRSAYQAANWSSYAFPGESAGDNAAGLTFAQYLQFPIDSIFYNGQIGLIPALPLWITPYDTASISHVGVNNVNAFKGGIEAYPNPATSYVTVSVELSAPVKTLSYRMIDNAGRIVAREAHTNVQNDQCTFNTAALASGNYNIVVFADDKMLYKKVTVLNK